LRRFDEENRVVTTDLRSFKVMTVFWSNLSHSTNQIAMKWFFVFFAWIHLLRFDSYWIGLSCDCVSSCGCGYSSWV